MKWTNGEIACVVVRTIGGATGGGASSGSGVGRAYRGDPGGFRLVTADAVVVLGAALTPGGVPGPALKRRLTHGVHVFNERGGAHLVVSGGVTRQPPAEAEVMRAAHKK